MLIWRLAALWRFLEIISTFLALFSVSWRSLTLVLLGTFSVAGGAAGAGAGAVKRPRAPESAKKRQRAPGTAKECKKMLKSAMKR